MVPLGPFGAAPVLAAGVSGGPHSLALALLARDWAVARGGTLLALIADHGLRPESGAESARVAAMLAGQGIAARVLRLDLESSGSGVQARARAARIAALLAAARAAGAPWLLLGHHRGDQAETLLHRAAAGSGPAGLAAMAPVRAAAEALVLRPLLDIPPARLEAVCAASGLAPVRDPSNRDPRYARIRLREALADPGGTGPEVAALAAAARAFGRMRVRREAALAGRLATAARLHPEGWAEIDPGALGSDDLARDALAALLRAVGGGAFAPPPARVAALLRTGEGTLGGAWLRRAGARWQLLREVAGAAAATPVPAVHGTLWDGRFRLAGSGAPGHVIAALGLASAAGLRGHSPMPLAVLAGLPAVWAGEKPGAGHSVLAAVPALLYPCADTAACFAMTFAPGAGSVG